ncbi:thermonuclease family protein [Mucilaginibacter sp. RS28]|uniref:Thermonuclease family protein n=1 Tax=Mucilaginibacter straminoryzae TaxID=2932774 RepID=A0A9X2BAY2_9SPHI|nr:thermonuclease family protein [Mucilaginibacter straminoryzae]MCJ8209267.1 thermonuclease family protein [Mucilaginibacter straminoryzae]
MLSTRNAIKRTLVFLLLAFVFACTREDQMRVVGVKDGDTIVVLTPDHQQITVRLAEVDCPEKSQAFGQAAKQFTSDLCFGKNVTLQGNEHDRYGRTIATVIINNKTNLNQELVKNGYAWHYAHYSNNATLAALQAEAQQKQLGLWQDANPTPPWEFRQNKREHKSNDYKQPKKKRRKRKHEFDAWTE